MGFRNRGDDVAELDDERTVFEGDLWEYKARNLARVAGISTEDDFNKLGRHGWEFVAVAQNYAIFKRRLAA